MIPIKRCNGCECPRNTVVTHIKADLLTSLQRMPSDSVVSFESEVLEYVDDIENVVNELKRVTGSSDNMFAVHLLGTRCGFPRGMDVNTGDALCMPHQRILTHHLTSRQ